METLKKNPRLRKPVATYLKMTEEQRLAEIKEKQEIYRMDQESRMDGAYRDGKKEGWQERDKQAREELEKFRREKLESARKMKNAGISGEQIVSFTGLPAEEIAKL
jgi:flagellar biosynthesis/type III secretory pathway protein FliH